MPTILHVIESLGQGGAEHQLALTVSALDPRFRSVVCHLHPPDDLAARIAAGGSRVVSLQQPRSKSAWPVCIKRLYELIRECRADLVHTSLFEADLLGGAAAALARVPCVSTLCNMGGEETRLLDNDRNSKLKLRLSTLLWGASLRNQHAHCIAISRSVAESAQRTYGITPADTSVVYRAIPPSQRDEKDLADAAHALRAELGWSQRYPFLLNVGRLAPQKGQRYAIQALPRLIEQFPSALLAIVGQGWLEPELRKVARNLGVEDHVAFLGKREDVPILMRACDVFLFPSLFEGLGVSALQAAAAGACCVVSNIGPLAEIFENERTGVLVAPRDAAALAQALLRVATEKAWARELGANARVDALRRFTVEGMARSVEGVYESVLQH